MENNTLSTCESFLEETLSQIKDGEKSKYCYKLKRWSTDTPFWTVFFCEKSTDRITRIHGNYCLSQDEMQNAPELLGKLVDTDVEIRITRKYFLSSTEEVF